MKSEKRYEKGNNRKEAATITMRADVGNKRN